MTIEKLNTRDTSDDLIRKINVLLDAVNDIKQAQIEHIKEFKGHRHLQGLTYPERDKLIKKLDYIELWIANHEKNILPRFKEEILKCLDEDSFRVKFQLALGLNLYANEKDLVKSFLPEKILDRPVDANKMTAFQAVISQNHRLKEENEKLRGVVEISKTLVSVASLYSAEHHYDFEKDIQAYDAALKELEGES